MNLRDWLTWCFRGRGRPLSLYKRGMAKAKRRDHRGAIEDYTATIELPGTPAGLVAMVLYNRALVYVAAGESQKGADDLQAVLAMAEADVNVKSMARQKLARMASRASRSNG